MAFSSNGSSGGFGRGRFRGTGTLSEMNVVPLVDVVLVLLIIFMLTAHVMEFGLEIKVPEVKSVQDTAEELPVVSVTRDAKLFLNGKPVNLNLIPSELKKRFPGAKAVYLQADAATIWNPIAQVISTLKDAKIPIM